MTPRQNIARWLAVTRSHELTCTPQRVTMIESRSSISDGGD